MIEKRSYGSTGLMVSSLGLGAIQIGHVSLSEATAQEVLTAALELGVNLIDTAPG